MTNGLNQYFNVLIAWRGYVTKTLDHSFEAVMTELTANDDIKEHVILEYACIIDFDSTKNKLEEGQCFIYVISDKGHAVKLQRG